MFRWLRMSLNLDITRHESPNNPHNQRRQAPHPQWTASFSQRSSREPPRSRQDQSRYRTTTAGPQPNVQRREQPPLRQYQSSRPTVNPPSNHRTARGTDQRIARPRNPSPPQRAQAHVVPSSSSSSQQQRRRASHAPIQTIESYWSLEGLPSHHEHRHIRRSRAENIARVTSWMDDHDGPARGYSTTPCANASRRSANPGSRRYRVDRNGPVRVIVPEDRPDTDFVAYFIPGSRREMLRARYHSYAKAQVQRMGDRFEQRFLNIFCR